MKIPGRYSWLDLSSRHHAGRRFDDASRRYSIADEPVRQIVAERARKRQAA